MRDDCFFLSRTFSLAAKAKGRTSPNPMVAAVIVKKGKVIAKGYHKAAGLPHAEVLAMQAARSSLKGAALYINLEPCCHYGRTPPCVDEIIDQGIKRVVIAASDPNPKVNGKAIAKLRRAGIKVKVGLLRDQAEKLNEVFFINMKKKRPFIAIKTAQTIDGKTASVKNISKWITSPASRKAARQLRDKYDSVLVGVNTVIVDNPQLNGEKSVPFKIVIDPGLKIPANSYLLKNDPDKLILFTSKKARARSFPKGVKVFSLKQKNGQLCLKDMAKILYARGIMSVFVEGGSTTIGGFFDQRLVDKAYFFISPKVLGGEGALGSISGKGYPDPDNCPRLLDISLKNIGDDLLITGYPRYPGRKR